MRTMSHSLSGFSIHGGTYLSLSAIFLFLPSHDSHRCSAGKYLGQASLDFHEAPSRQPSDSNSDSIGKQNTSHLLLPFQQRENFIFRLRVSIHPVSAESLIATLLPWLPG